MKVQSPTPVAPEPATESPAAPVTPPAAPAATSEWLKGVDTLLAILALLVALLSASVAARNADLWLGLASGRLITEGTLSLGGDPFGGTGRAWVQTSWLTNTVGYLLYSLAPAGGVLVAAKATLVMAGFLVGLLLRPAGASLAPWALFIVLGAAASAPQVAPARSLVVSMVLAPLLIVYVYRRLGRGALAGRLGELAILQWVWANADDDFWLGPAILLVVLLGELVDRRRSSEAALGVAPPVNRLALGLAVTVAASLLNPWFLAAFAQDPAAALTQLVPVETRLFLPPAGTDPELRVLTLGGFDLIQGDFQRQPTAAAGLVAFTLLGAAVLIASAVRLRTALLFLWVGSALLAALSVQFVPYFAVIATPVAAALANGVAGRAADRSEAATRVLATLGGLGRVLVFALALGLAVLAYPGRLQPRPADPALAARVEWKVAPDAGGVRTAQAVAALPPADGVTVNTSSVLGSYLAFYAPGQKVFLDGRYAFRRPELARGAALRLGLVRVTGLPPDQAQAAFVQAREILDDLGCTRLVLTGLAVPGARLFDPQIAAVLTQGDRRWSLAHLDGRGGVLGRNGVRADFVKEAFGTQRDPLPAGVAVPPPPRDLGLAGEFVTAPQPLPLSLDDSQVYFSYQRLLSEVARGEAVARGQRAGGALAGGFASQVPVPGGLPTDQEVALAYLGFVAARRAVVEAPDRAEVYQQLAVAYETPVTPVADESSAVGPLQMSERQFQRIAAIARYLDRTPLPARANQAQAFEAASLGIALAALYEQTGQIDAAKATLDLANEYLAKLPPDAALAFARTVMTAPEGTEPQKILDAFRKSFDDRLDQQRQQIQRTEDQVARLPDPAQRLNALLSNRMPLAALRLYEREADAINRTLRGVEAAVVMTNLRLGRIQEAADYLGSRRDSLEAEAARSPDDPVVQLLVNARGLLARALGDFTAARQAVPAPAFPPADPRVNFDAPPLRSFEATAGLVGATLAAIGTPEGANLPLAQAIARDETAKELLLAQSLLAKDRAVLALAEGLFPVARAEFEVAAAPQGVPIEKLGRPERVFVIQTYLRLLAATGP